MMDEVKFTMGEEMKWPEMTVGELMEIRVKYEDKKTVGAVW